MNRIVLAILCIFFIGHSAHAQVITTYAGNGTAGFSGDGGPAIAAQLQAPYYIAIDAAGNLYITDGLHVRKVAPSGIITTIAGTGSTSMGDGGPATAAGFGSSLEFIATDAVGNVYITDVEEVRRISSSGIITRFAGDPSTYSFGGDGGAATAAGFYSPAGLAADGAGNVYICDAGNKRVRIVNPAGIINTFAGNGAAGYSGDGGAATNAQIVPESVAADASGNVFIGDLDHHCVRKVSTAGIISTYAGTGIAGFSGDGGPATDATLSYFEQIATDNVGNLYICDGNTRVRKVSAAGIITTVAGNGISGFAGDGFVATACELNEAHGVAWEPGCGSSLYISDRGNERVRRIVFNNNPPTFTAGHTHSIHLCPGTGAVTINSMLAITDSDSGQPETWAVITPAAHGTLIGAYSATSTGGGITPSGLSYTPAAGYTGTDTFRVSIIDCGNVPDTATFYISVTPLPSAGVITVIGAEFTDTLCIGQVVTLGDTATGGAWSSSNTNAAVGSAGSLSGVVSGISPGADTIRYIVANACGADTATHAVVVKACNDEVKAPPSRWLSGSQGEVTVMPNPNDGVFTLNITSPLNEQADIIITNIVGEKIKDFTATTNTQIPVRINAPAGIYFIAATTQDGRYTTKVVVSPAR